MIEETYVVRSATREDLIALAAIEEARWGREGTDILSLQTLEEWFQTNSPYFLVAEKEGEVLGFYYGIQVRFSMQHIDEFASTLGQSGSGYTAHVHDSTGNCVYAVTVVVIAPEVGVLLNNEVHKRMRLNGILYFIGVSRLVHLDHYLKGIEKSHGGTLPYSEKEIALWYTHESMKMMSRNKNWNECTKQPQLDLPPLRRPDSVLKFHVEAINAGLLRIIPNYMRDPKSRDYGALLVSEIPRK